jgi:hypothetical protein
LREEFAPITRPDPVSLHLRWLLSGPVRLPNGLIAAWVEGGQPSHAYQEATGYLLTLLCFSFERTGAPGLREAARRTAAALGESVRDGAGRDGAVYLFDTAVCLRGLNAFSTTFGDEPEAERAAIVVASLADIATEMIQRREARRGGEPGARWSDRFFAHLIKAVQQVHAAAPDRIDRETAAALARELWDGPSRDEFFRLPGEDTAYLHAHAYALEGLLGLGESITDPLRRLAAAQRFDGAMPRDLPGDGAPAVDATAQAVRLWQCVDAAEFAEPITRGLAFLETMAAPGGGFYYAPDVAHVNAWTTMFAVQALTWRDGGAAARWIL